MHAMAYLQSCAPFLPPNILLVGHIPTFDCTTMVPLLQILSPGLESGVRDKSRRVPT
jgi:hypothetical protein